MHSWLVSALYVVGCVAILAFDKLYLSSIIDGVSRGYQCPYYVYTFSCTGLNVF